MSGASRLLLCSLLLGWTACVQPFAAKAERTQPDTDYGSFTTSTRQCNLVQNGSTRRCAAVQLTQRGSAGLRIRFVASSDQPGGSHWVTFIARHRSGVRALSCNNGSCEREEQNWTAEVISASIARFDDRGVPLGLPDTSAMDGECRIESRLIQCDSRSNNGMTLRAEARL